MAGVPAVSEVTDGHRGGRRTAKDTKLGGQEDLEENREGGVAGRQRREEVRGQEERGKLDQK